MQTQLTCPGCSTTFRSKPEWAGRRVKCAKCNVPIPVPHTKSDDENDAGTSASPRWLILAAVGLIAAAVGAACGYVVGYRQVRLHDKRELVDFEERTQSLNEKLQASDVNNTKLQSELNSLKSELAAFTLETDALLIAYKKKENAADARANEAEKKLAAGGEVNERFREEELRKAEAFKKVDTIQVSTVREALKIHENPKNYVGKKIVISKDIALIIGDEFRRNSESDGYLFSWLCGATASGAESLGYSLGLDDDKLNYWCDTDTGLLAKEKLKAERSGGNVYYRRTMMTFNIKTKKIEKNGREREYYIAEFTLVEPK